MEGAAKLKLSMQALAKIGVRIRAAFALWAAWGGQCLLRNTAGSECARELDLGVPWVA